MNKLTFFRSEPDGVMVPNGAAFVGGERLGSEMQFIKQTSTTDIVLEKITSLHSRKEKRHLRVTSLMFTS